MRITRAYLFVIQIARDLVFFTFSEIYLQRNVDLTLCQRLATCQGCSLAFFKWKWRSDGGFGSLSTRNPIPIRYFVFAILIVLLSTRDVRTSRTDFRRPNDTSMWNKYFLTISTYFGSNSVSLFLRRYGYVTCHPQNSARLKKTRPNRRIKRIAIWSRARTMRDIISRARVTKHREHRLCAVTFEKLCAIKICALKIHLFFFFCG